MNPKSKTSVVVATNTKSPFYKLKITIGVSIVLMPSFMMWKNSSDQTKVVQDVQMEIRQIRDDNFKAMENMQMQFKQVKQDQQITVLSLNEVIPVVNDLVAATNNYSNQINALQNTSDAYSGMGTGNITTKGCYFINTEHAIESNVILNEKVLP